MSLSTTTSEGGPALAMTRARAYRVLASACARPADDLLIALLSDWEAGAEPGTADSLALIGSGVDRIRAWQEESRGLPGTSDVLSAEFTRLFRGLKRHDSPRPPYESVYLDGGLLYGTSTDAVRRCYARFGLGSQDNEPPDHIALELDFMSHLCEREALARQAGETAEEWTGAQESFVDEHLARWVPDLADGIRGSDTTGFYAGLADVLEGWVFRDRQLMAGDTNSE